MSNVSTNEVGKAILPFLRDLDVIAYLHLRPCTGPSTRSKISEEAIRALRERSQGVVSPTREEPGESLSLKTRKAREPQAANR